MSDDTFDDIIKHIDWKTSGIGVPINDTDGAIIAMLAEHCVDYEETSKWLLGILIIAIEKMGATIDMPFELHRVAGLTSSEVAIEGLNKMSLLLQLLEGAKKRGRRTQR